MYLLKDNTLIQYVDCCYSEFLQEISLLLNYYESLEKIRKEI